MVRCRSYFETHPCKRLLDLGCGFGRWAQYLSGNGVGEVVGLDYASGGVRLASAWVKRAGFNARFVAGSATALPFHEGTFDGVLAALILDNLSREDCVRAVRELSAVTRAGGRGYFVFSPVLTPGELAGASDNPTKGCTHVVYEDDELAACLPGWTVTAVDSSAERFRLIEATFQH